MSPAIPSAQRRFLQSDAPTAAPSVIDPPRTELPTAEPTSPPQSDDKSAAQGFGFFILLALVLVAIFVAWRMCRIYRRKREERMLHLRSAQADRVLGDMQMVPNEDMDENEML